VVFGLIGWMENNRIDAMNLKFKKYDQVFHAVHLTAFGEVLTGSGSARVSRSPEGVSLDGSSKGEVSDSSSPIFFTGKIFDSGLQAYHFLYRNYSPTQARWTAADPSGFPDGPNQWLYVNNGVTGSVDPLGLEVRTNGDIRDPVTWIEERSWSYSVTDTTTSAIIGTAAGLVSESAVVAASAAIIAANVSRALTSTFSNSGWVMIPGSLVLTPTTNPPINTSRLDWYGGETEVM